MFFRKTLLFGGFSDNRFRGYGHEHVEHTCLLCRVGNSPATADPDRFKSIWGGIGGRSVQSTFNAKCELAELSRRLGAELMGDLSYGGSWRTEAETWQFRDEMRQAVAQEVR